MPTAMSFQSLIGDLQSYLERGTVLDPTVYAQLPKLINNAEREIATKLKIEGFINVITSNFNVGATVYTKPDRWRRTISMAYGSGASSNSRTPIFPRSYEYCRMYWPDASVLGVPEFYADYDYAHWLIVGTPQSALPWEIVYYQQPPLLDDVNQTNWLTNYAPTTLLYRALLEATPFLKNDDRIGVWQGMYQESLQNLDTDDIKKAVDRAATREGA